MPEQNTQVLLVDDQALERRAFLRFVQTQDLPWDVVAVGSIAEAGGHLARGSFDIAMVDQRLGDGVGIDLLPSLIGTPAVVLTRPGDEAIAAHAVAAGAYGFLVRDSGRKYLQLVLPTVTAVLARRRAEVAAAMRAEEVVRTRAEFQRVATMMWHEVIGSLAALLDILEMLQMDGEANPALLPPDTASNMKQAICLAARIERLITDVLGYYRLQAPPSLVAVDLDAVVRDVVANLPAAIWHDAVVTQHTLPPVSGDPSRLRLLFRQLFENAATLRGLAPLHVDVTAQQTADAVRVTLTDNGMGLQASVRDPVAFAQDQPSDGDLGLSLSICKRIIEQHGGRIWFDLGSDTGTAVHLLLPDARLAVRSQSPAFGREG